MGELALSKPLFLPSSGLPDPHNKNSGTLVSTLAVALQASIYQRFRASGRIPNGGNRWSNQREEHIATLRLYLPWSVITPWGSGPGVQVCIVNTHTNTSLQNLDTGRRSFGFAFLSSALISSVVGAPNSRTLVPVCAA